jgi:hypothetical protein
MSVRGISTPFGELFPTSGQVRTCSSAVRHSTPEGAACDLHALGTPPALILSQDQTRQKMVKLPKQISPRRRPRCGGQGDARSTRQLVRCEATKKRAGCWLQPTRLNATLFKVCTFVRDSIVADRKKFYHAPLTIASSLRQQFQPDFDDLRFRAKPCRCRRSVVYQSIRRLANDLADYARLVRLLRSARRVVTTRQSIPATLAGRKPRVADLSSSVQAHPQCFIIVLFNHRLLHYVVE